VTHHVVVEGAELLAAGDAFVPEGATKL